MKSTEFHEIAFAPGEYREVMSKPKPMEATKKFITEIQEALGIPDDKATEAADWILNKMERYGARSAQPIFDMEGNGPSCSWCMMIWPLCGHHHMSEEMEDDETKAETE